MVRFSLNIIVRRIFGIILICFGVGIGSEMFGGISNIIIEDIYVWNLVVGVRIKIDVGRGGYIANIFINNLILEGVKVFIKFSRGANDYLDDRWDLKVVFRVGRVFISNVVSLNSKRVFEILGIEGLLYESICMRNVSIFGLRFFVMWYCEYVSGFASKVFLFLCF